MANNIQKFFQISPSEEKELLHDPTKVSSRIFIGGLATDGMNRMDLYHIFKKFGTMLGASLYKGFALIQFENEESAREAVINGRLLQFRGKKMHVKPARPLIKGGQHAPPEYIEGRDRSPIGMETFIDRGREPSKYPQDRRLPPLFLQAEETPERTGNDLEIIVVNKAQTEYAEYIETKLRRLGLTVDLLFPNGDVPVARVVSNIANNGSLFGLIVMPQNEEHRSVTLNILHGPPQEHRNMPLEDAITLITRSYEAYKLKEATSRPSEVPLAVAAPLVSRVARPAPERHPENIRILLNLLAENRMLTVLQYDTIITYLQGRREIQVKVELGDGAPPIVSATAMASSTAPAIAASKQQELQSRILSILNSKAPSGTPMQQPLLGVPTPVQPVTADSNKPPALLTNPSVQRALNSLMSADILKKMAN